MVGVKNRNDIELCDDDTLTLTCAPRGACVVGLAGQKIVQGCNYDQMFIENSCPNINTHLCCKEDLCNSLDNFTEFRAGQENTGGSSTNIDASSATSLIGMTSIVTPSSVGESIFSFL